MTELPANQTEPRQDWDNIWYPVSFVEDVPKDTPMGFRLQGKPIVLFVDGDDQIVCLLDRCPHRAARLSDGRIVDGKIECLYHGWQFEAGGRCAHIPQLYPEKVPPARACATAFPLRTANDLVWVWIGDPDKAETTPLPELASAQPGLTQVTFQMDLPYDHSYLIENVIDVAHIHFAHDGVRGGGHRAAAKPLEFHLLHSDATGFASRFRSVGLSKSPEELVRHGALVEFVAPYLVRYATQYAEDNLVSGLELIAVPLAPGRCRLLYRKYSNFTSWRERIKPRWMEHMTQRLILEQDMSVIVGQSAEVENANIPLRDLWLPIKTSDRIVIEYRKWLDKYGSTLKNYRGFSTASQAGLTDQSQPHPQETSAKLHNSICTTCRPMAGRLRLARGAGLAIALLLACLALVQPAQSVGYVLAMLAALAVTGGIHRLRKAFL